MENIKIILADDHQLVREGIRAVLDRESDFSVVAEAKDGAEAVEKTAAHRPHILLLDLTLPKLHGLHVLSKVRSFRTVKTIVITMHVDPASALEALRLGARGYVLKDSPSVELIAAIRMVVKEDDIFVSKRLEAVVKRSACQMTQTGVAKATESITHRERMVLREVAAGLPTDGIARTLGISPRTVEKHRSNFMRKLMLRSQGDVVLFAIREGLIQL